MPLCNLFPWIMHNLAPVSISSFSFISPDYKTSDDLILGDTIVVQDLCVRDKNETHFRFGNIGNVCLNVYKLMLTHHVQSYSVMINNSYIHTYYKYLYRAYPRNKTEI